MKKFQVNQKKIIKKKTSDEDTTSKRYIKIIFIFTKRCGNFYPMREDISLDSTIGDIIEMIKKTHNIKDKIKIKANEKNETI